MNINISIINQLVRAVREYINMPWKNYQLRQNEAMFSQLCSSLNMIDDADNAIRIFEKGEFPEETSSLYLMIIGVLQALIIQQDSVYHLAQSVGFKFSVFDDVELVQIRNIRNESIGHPTKKNLPKSEPASYNHIIQISLTKQGFELLSFLEDGCTNHKYVDLLSIISKQTRILSIVLAEILKMLEQENSRHIKRFREEKLLKIFHPSTSYHSDKVVEAAYQDDEPEFGIINLDVIIKTVQEFRNAIKNRNMDMYESLNHDYELIGYLETQIRSYFQSRIDHKEPKLEQLGVEIFARALKRKVGNLNELAKEIDSDYDD